MCNLYIYKQDACMFLHCIKIRRMKNKNFSRIFIDKVMVIENHKYVIFCKIARVNRIF